MTQAHTHSPGTRRWQHWSLIAAFVLLQVGLIGGNLLAWQNGLFTETTKNGWQDFVRGAPMAALAEDLRTTEFVSTLGRLQREAGWLLLKDTGPQVRTGCPGWLFLVDELVLHPSRSTNARQRAELVARIQAELSRRDSQLLVVLVPDKSRVEAAQLCRLERPAALAQRLDDWKQQLESAGVTVVDTTPALKSRRDTHGAVFYRSDTHWNLDGAEAAAEAVAAVMIAMGFETASPIQLTVEYDSPRPRWGDLVRLAGLDRLPENWRPEPDQVPKVRFIAPATQPTALDVDALFGETAKPRIALLGTSFSRNAHFADYLVKALGTEVGNLARDGGGFAGSITDFLRSDSSQASQWVIWEIPERFLEAPLGPEEQALQALIEALAANQVGS